MRNPDRVFWFHLTRVPPSANFSEGILPMNLALPRIWDTVEGVVEDTPNHESFKEFRAKGRGSFQYELKKDCEVHAGPFAMLVRESAFKAKEMGNHDYLDLPEIVEDICNGYQEHTGKSIHRVLRTALTPCIVKFWSDGRRGPDCVEAALFYLYSRRHGEPLSIEGNTCFDGGGQVVAPERIVSIEMIHEEQPA